MAIPGLEATIAAAKKIKEIKEAHYNIRKGSKQNFNFFTGILGDRQYWEKYHSNFIAYLLNPKGSHDCEYFFFQKFIKHLKVRLKDEMAERWYFVRDFSCDSISVVVEKTIYTGRRLDIAIESNKDWLIFIENKVESKEGTDQIKDYSEYSKNNYTEWLGIYLTKDGESSFSTKGTDFEKTILNLSYHDIIEWLNSCLTDQELIKYPHITSVLIQYIAAIKLILNIMEDKEIEDVKNYLTQNSKELISILENINNLCSAAEKIIQDKREVFIGLLKQIFIKTIHGRINGLSFVGNDEKYFEFSYQGNHFLVSIEQSFPIKDEDGGRGLWWGIYKKGDHLYPKFKLKKGHWQSLLLPDGIEDHKSTNEGSIKILKAFDEGDQGKLALGAVEEIISNLSDKVLKSYSTTGK